MFNSGAFLTRSDTVLGLIYLWVNIVIFLVLREGYERGCGDETSPLAEHYFQDQAVMCPGAQSISVQFSCLKSLRETEGGMSVNLKKTKIMIFQKSPGRQDHKHSFKLDNMPLERSQNYLSRDNNSRKLLQKEALKLASQSECGWKIKSNKVLK